MVGGVDECGGRGVGGVGSVVGRRYGGEFERGGVWVGQVSRTGQSR